MPCGHQGGGCWEKGSLCSVGILRVRVCQGMSGYVRVKTCEDLLFPKRDKKGTSKRLLRITLDRWAFDPWLQVLPLKDPKLRYTQNPVNHCKPPKWSKQGKCLSLRDDECLTTHHSTPQSSEPGRGSTARYVDSDFFWHLLGWQLEREWVGRAFSV